MRLFTAINFDADIKNQLFDISNEVKAFSQKGSFTLKNNFHITLVFLGETDPKKLPLLKETINNIIFEPFIVEIDEIDFFEKSDGYIYWIGIKKNFALKNLQNKLSDALREKGFAFDERVYTPHITLGRRIELQAKADKTKIHAHNTAIKTEVKRISLLKSENINGVLKYSEI